MKNKNFFLIFPYLLSVFCIFFVWHFFARFLNSPLILPSPEKVFCAIFKLFRTDFFYISLFRTFFRVLCAFFFAAIFGSILGFFCGFSPFFKRFLSVPLSFVRATPVVSIILIAIFWFGSNNVPTFTAILMALPISVNAISEGFSNSQKKLLEMAKIYEFSWWEIFFFIRLPAIFPFFKNALSSIFGMCWKVVLAGEVLSLPKNALGSALYDFQTRLDTADVFAVTICASLMSFLGEKVLEILFCSQKNKKSSKKNDFQISKNQKSTKNMEPKIVLQKNNSDFQKKSVITLKNLTIERGEKTLLKNFFLEVFENEIIAFFAPSGSGKTTILDFFSSLQTKNSLQDAKISFDEAKIRGKISYVFQDLRLLENLSAEKNVSLAIEKNLGKKTAIRTAKNFLDLVFLSEKGKSKVSKLSGGEKQRVAIARAFAFPSEIIFLDEPFTALDFQVREKIISSILERQKNNARTIILVSHNREEIEKFGARIISL